MVPSLLSGSPEKRMAQKLEQFEAEMERMMDHFPDTKKEELQRFLRGFGAKADKAIPAYEDHLKW